MMRKIIAIVAVLFISAGFLGNAHAVIPTEERNALIDLYNSTNGASWSDNTNWLGAEGTECTWYGVACDAGNTHVTNLYLSNNQLKGDIPASMGNLSNLTTLHLWDNQLTGTIPSSLANLSNLTVLSLGGNQLTGIIPAWLGNLTNLEFLVLRGNQLTGNIPAELGNLTNLQELWLQENQLAGSIPSELGSLSNLTKLVLYTNQLTGSIPAELGNLSNLQDLRLSYNQLTGSIPGQLGNLSNLEILYLGDNQLTGNIPSELGNLLNLKDLQIWGCQLDGIIPSWLGNLTNLEILFLRDNQLTGNIPAELGNLINLQELWLQGNQLTGSIPSELGNLSNLTKLVLHTNQLTGSIPPELGNLLNLEDLRLSYNQLTGDIPPELGNLSKLNILYLSNNQFTGNIPSELGNLLNVTDFELSNNQLSGVIPESLGNLTNLTQLELDNNQLAGSIPSSLGNLTNLTKLWLNNNQLSGSIPAELKNLTNLADNQSDFRNNQLYTSDPDLRAFLNAKQIDGDWESSQTVTPLVADFAANSASGTAPLTVQFTDSSEGNPTSWQWDFNNDGTVDSTEQHPSFTYNAGGIYSVRLAVSDGNSTDEEVKTNYIKVSAPVVSNFAADKTSGTAPLTVKFTDQSSGSPTSWEWDFDNDGVVDSEEQHPSFTYNAGGIYSVRLAVSDGNSTDVELKTNYIGVSAPVASDFAASRTLGVAPLAVRFTDLSSVSPVSWQWDFDNDGISDSEEQNPAWTYEQPGTYTVSLTVSDGTKEYTEIKTNYLTVSGMTTSYYGEVLSVTPKISDGTQNIQITGQAVEKATGLPLPEVPLNLTVSVNGFERRYNVFTYDDGTFTTTFFPAAEDFGTFQVWAVHPDISDKAVQDEFVIERLIISPAATDLNLARNYEQSVRIRVTNGTLADVHNLQLTYEAGDQTGAVFPKGIHVTPDSPLTVLASGQSADFSCSVWADKQSDEHQKIVLRVKSDEKEAGEPAVINLYVSDAKPVLFFTPDHLETGLGRDETVTETIVLENKGLASLNDMSLSLVKEDGTSAPTWVHLNSAADQGTLILGEKRNIGISFTPGASVAEGMYSFYLRVSSSNHPVTDILVFVAVTQSGKGNVLFKVSDIYTETPDPETNEMIQGLAGAEITVQNVKVPTVEYTQTTDSTGETLFADLPAGRYKYRAAAADHQEHIGIFWIRPGITKTEAVFLDYDLVTVEWDVTETAIEDEYEVVMNVIYKTNVPAALVVAIPASVTLPRMNPGDVFNGSVKFVNYGLIRADDLQFTPPQNGKYKYEFLLNRLPESLGAMESVTLPYRITYIGSPARESRQHKPECYVYMTCGKIEYKNTCANGGTSKGSAKTCVTEMPACPNPELQEQEREEEDNSKNSGNNSPSPKPLKGSLCREPLPDEDECENDDVCCNSERGDSGGSLVDLLSGEYTDDATDLFVMVPGHRVEVIRRYYDDAWHFNHSDQDLKFFEGGVETEPGFTGSRRSARGGQVDMAAEKYIVKDGVKYKQKGQLFNVFSFGSDQNIFLEQGGGYRWKNRSGDWMLYDGDGRPVAYGNRYDQQVSFIYDNGKVTGIADNSDKQVLWYEYNGEGLISAVQDADGRRAEYFYTSGRLTRVADVLGNDAFYAYDAEGRLESKTDPGGRITNIAYNDFGFVESVTDENGIGRSYEYAFDEKEEEYYAGITYSSGKVKEIWYDDRGRKIRTDMNGRTEEDFIHDDRSKTTFDEGGNEICQEYDEWGNVVKRSYSDGSEVSYQYEGNFDNLVMRTDENGVITKYEYDDAGNMIKMIEAAGTPNARTTEYTYDGFGNRLTEKRAGNNNTAESMTSMAYDEIGNLISVTDPEGNVTRFTYDVMGNVLTKEDAGGKLWQYEYDAAGRQTKASDPLGNETKYAYDAADNRIKEIDANENETLFEYDAKSRLIKITDALGNISLMAYDSEGQLIKRTDAEAKVSLRYEYDADGRLAKTIDGNGNEVITVYGDSGCSSCGGQVSQTIYPTFSKEFEYDSRGRRTKETDVLSWDEKYAALFEYDFKGNLLSKTDKEGNPVSYAYDELSRQIRVTDALDQETTFEYDARDNLIALKDPEGNETRFEYDGNNRVVKEIRPMGEATSYEYNEAGLLTVKTDPKHQRTEYEYDDAGRMTGIRYFSSDDHQDPVKSVSFSYDNAGNLLSYNDGVTSAAYVLDKLNRKIAETVNYGDFSLSYAYAYYRNGMKKSFTGPDGVTYEYTYDDNNQLTGISIPGEGTVAFDAYQWNRPSVVRVPGGVMREYSYDSLMRIKAITVTDPGQNVLMDYRYAYDRMNNILTKETEHGRYAYGYDSTYRLKTADNAVLDDEAYTYDKVGNRLTANGVSGNWTYNDNNELLGYDGYTLDYDANGNMKKKSGNGETVVYVYNAENRLTRVENGGGSVVAEYYYDPFGRRLWKDVGGVKTFFVYADEGLVGEYDENGAVIKTYGYEPNSIWTTDPMFMRQGDEYYFYQNDRLGTPLQMTDMNGDVVWSVRYDAFGETEASSTVVNHLRFPGQYYDGETGDHYNLNRYYAPLMGRYFKIDPIKFKGGFNLYSYVKNNPISRIDPNGLKVYVCGLAHVSIKIKSECNPPGIDGEWGFAPEKYVWSDPEMLLRLIPDWIDGKVTKQTLPGCTLRYNDDSHDQEIYDKIMRDISDPPCYSALTFNCIFWMENILYNSYLTTRKISMNLKRRGSCGKYGWFDELSEWFDELY